MGVRWDQSPLGAEAAHVGVDRAEKDHTETTTLELEGCYAKHLTLPQHANRSSVGKTDLGK